MWTYYNVKCCIYASILFSTFVFTNAHKRLKVGKRNNVFDNMYKTGNILSKIKRESVYICLASCYDHIDCRSIAYNTKDRRCQLFDRNFQNQNSADVGFYNDGWKHYDVSQGSCKVGLTTANDCSEVQSRGHDCSGVYTIKPSSTSTVQVWCDLHTDGGRWTVVQRRQDGSVDFDMNWVSYRTGFGDPRTEYWIGNENLFGLTSSGKTELLILMETWNGVWRYARYSEFWISSESDKYRLGLSGYRGTAGDSLINSSQQAGCQFSTRDRDNDKFYEGACTDFVSGGFWYNLCAMATLNGYYYTSAVTGVPTCHWNTFKYQESLKTVYMMVRKV